MDAAIWRLRRLGKMSAGEIAGRVRDAAVKQLWRFEKFRPDVAERLSGPGAVVLPPVDELPLVVTAKARRAVVQAADRVLAGTALVLGKTSRLLGERPDWFSDVSTARRAPQLAYCFDVPYRNPRVVGEVKYVWEPSRHHHLTLLAAAFYLSGDHRYAERVAGHLVSWWSENPFLRGIHWTSGIEIGIRLLSWVWTRRLLAAWPEVAGLFEGNPLFLRQLYWHQAYLATLPSRGSSANNHRVAEVVGLFAASSFFPLFPASRRWRAAASRAIEQEISAQCFADGLNKELATAYHGFVLELFLAAAAEDDPDTPCLGPGFQQTLARMVDALASMVDCRGCPPRQGDDDQGQALAVDGDGFDRWHSLLATGGHVAGRLPWWPAPNSGDLRAALLASTIRPLRGDVERPAAPIRHFVEGGMVLLTAFARTDDELWCRCDHGPLGFLATAAHGHADALAIEVRCGGVDVLCDPGTYCYHGHDAWRRYFRSTLAHNTLELDGVSQCRDGGTFLWLDQPGSSLIAVSGLDRGDVAEWEAEHDGYRTLKRPAVHRRRVRLDRRTRTVDVFDILIGSGRHRARLAFHLGPRVDCRLIGVVARLSWPAAGGMRTARFTLPAALQWSLHRGEEGRILGWYSAAFGRLEPSVTLVGGGEIGSDELQSRLVFDQRTVASASVPATQEELVRRSAAKAGTEAGATGTEAADARVD
jgi:hypothetical protein